MAAAEQNTNGHHHEQDQRLNDADRPHNWDLVHGVKREGHGNRLADVPPSGAEKPLASG